MEHKILKQQSSRKALLFFQILFFIIFSIMTFIIYKIDSIPRYNFDRNAVERVSLAGDYTNIAFFGLDTRPGDNEPSRTDTIMIASINNRTGEIRIISVFRDTVMLQLGGALDKASHAYAFGGPQEAVAMLNRNLDMDIEKYIAVNFISLAAIIDALGGVEVEVSSEELYYINRFADDTAVISGLLVPTWLPEDQPGMVRLEGAQAVAFTRIRSTEGGDFRRAQRQREVLEEVMRKVTRANPMQLLRLVNTVPPELLTNMTTWEILGQSFNLLRRNMGAMEGYPLDLTTGRMAGSDADYVIPMDKNSNVRQLHGFLFDDFNYQPTERINQIGDSINWNRSF